MNWNGKRGAPVRDVQVSLIRRIHDAANKPGGQFLSPPLDVTFLFPRIMRTRLMGSPQMGVPSAHRKGPGGSPFMAVKAMILVLRAEMAPISRAPAPPRTTVRPVTFFALACALRCAASQQEEMSREIRIASVGNFNSDAMNDAGKVVGEAGAFIPCTPDCDHLQLCRSAPHAESDQARSAGLTLLRDRHNIKHIMLQAAGNNLRFFPLEASAACFHEACALQSLWLCCR
jgi:hypothetical protein